MRILGHLAVFVCAAIPLCVYAQSNPTLKITSPATQTIVHPGEVVNVLVVGTGQPANGKEAIIGQAPLGGSNVQTSASQLTFSLSIPSFVTAGSYTVTAVETLAGGRLIQSTPVVVVVPQASAFTSLTIKNKGITLPRIGQQATLNVIGINSSGTSIVDGEDVSFNSLNPAIVTVDANGVVTAHAIGTAGVVVTSGNISVTATVLVTGTSRAGDLNGDGQVDINDIKILDSALNTPADGPNDPRDLNHDSKIDALDARILTTLCTYPHCATHP